MIYIASQPEELEEIFLDYEHINKSTVTYIEDVIEHIVEIKKQKNV